MNEQIHHTGITWKKGTAEQIESRSHRIDQEFIWETAIALLSMSISEYIDKNIEYQELDQKINNPDTGILEIVPQLFQEKGLDIKDRCYNIPDDVKKAIARLNQELINQGSTITIKKMIELDRHGAIFEIMSQFNIDAPDPLWDFRVENFDYETKNWDEKFQVDRYLVKMALDAIYPNISARAYQNHKIGKDIWLETTEERYDDLFGAVPLIFNNQNSFLISEPYYDSKKGTAYIACKTESDTQWFLKLMTRQEYLSEFRNGKAS
jgi:hypothetical protein